MTPEPLSSSRHENADIAALENVLRWRRDVREFLPEAISESTLADIIAAAELAPSVGLSQPWRVVRVDDNIARSAIKANFETANARAYETYEDDSAHQYAKLKLAGFDTAPVHFAVYCEADPAQGKNLGRMTMPRSLEYSVVCMIHTLMLAAHVRGIGAGWVSILDPEEVNHALNAPSSWNFVAYLLLGFPKERSDIPGLMRSGWEMRSHLNTRWFVK